MHCWFHHGSTTAGCWRLREKKPIKSSYWLRAESFLVVPDSISAAADHFTIPAVVEPVIIALKHWGQPAGAV
jgi:hypothetical protein